MLPGHGNAEAGASGIGVAKMWIRRIDRRESHPWGINWYGAWLRPLKIADASISSPGFIVNLLYQLQMFGSYFFLVVLLASHLRSLLDGLSSRYVVLWDAVLIYFPVQKRQRGGRDPYQGPIWVGWTLEEISRKERNQPWCYKAPKNIKGIYENKIK